MYRAEAEHAPERKLMCLVFHRGSGHGVSGGWLSKSFVNEQVDIGEFIYPCRVTLETRAGDATDALAESLFSPR